MVPRLSSIGRQAARQAAAAASSAASSRREPTSAFAAGSIRSAVGATAPSPTRAAAQTPSFNVRLTPRPTTAISISVRGIMRRYASPDPFGRDGKVKLTRISPGFRLVRPGPTGTSSTFIWRRPFGPCTVTTAPAAIIAGTLSPAGEPLQRLPPADARPSTCLYPIRFTASSTPGQTLPKRGCSESTAPETAAPRQKPPSAVSSIVVISAIFLISTINPGRTRPARICTRRSVPPARMRAALPAAAKAPIASSSVPGAMYLTSVILFPRFPFRPPALPAVCLFDLSLSLCSLHGRAPSEQAPRAPLEGILLCKKRACGRPPTRIVGGQKADRRRGGASHSSAEAREAKAQARPPYIFNRFDSAATKRSQSASSL